MGQQVTLNGQDPLSEWHGRHSLEYSLTEKRLADTKAKFMSADYAEAEEMFEKSYIYTIISQQSPVGQYEPAFVNYVNGMDMAEAFQPVNYKRQKQGYIEDTLHDEEKVARCVRTLKQDRPVDFVDFAVEHVKGLAWAKAPFVPAMLGFTSMACADTNVCQTLDIDKVDTRQDYELFRDKLRDDIPIEADMFLRQWVAFDFNRGFHEPHRNWFQAIGTWSDRRNL